MSDVVIALFILICLVVANLPWFSERWFGFIPIPNSGEKRFIHCLKEWLALYAVAGLLALGLEKQVVGEIYEQGWEFYAVTFCLFIVFAAPGFIYRYGIRRVL